MAHTFGTASARATSAGNPITTANFTINALDTVLVLMIKTAAATDRAGGAPVFGGRTMKQASTTQKAAASPEAGCELWYLLKPLSGAYAATIPNTGALTLFYTFATGRAVPGGRSALDGEAGANNTAANPSPGAVSCTEPGDIGFAITAGGWQTWAPSAQAGTVIANTDDGAHGGGEQYILQATIAPVTLGWTFATSDDWGAVAVFFKEIPPNIIKPNSFPVVASGLSTGDNVVLFPSE